MADQATTRVPTIKKELLPAVYFFAEHRITYSCRDGHLPEPDSEQGYTVQSAGRHGPRPARRGKVARSGILHSFFAPPGLTTLVPLGPIPLICTMASSSFAPS